MATTDQDEHAVSMKLTDDELMIINNAINEILHGIHVPDFQTRIGPDQDEARKLLRRISAALDDLEGVPHRSTGIR